MKRIKTGFTLMEMLIVIAIIAVLIAIAIPVFSSQLEKTREATDLTNVRSAYAQVSTEALLGNSEITVTVDLTQKQADWQSWDPVDIGGIVHYKKQGKNNGHTIQRDCVTVFISIVLPTLFASTSYWRCSRMAACVVATKSRNKQASSIAILRLQSKLFNGQSVNKTGGMIYSSPWYLGSFL